MDSSSPFSRKSIRQPVFGRGGMNFDGASGVEMVTSTTTQFQQTTTSVIRSNNLNEVHSIINRVDSAYKLRKKECQRLQWEISDLESQLEDIQRQTLEYTETSAIQNASLSWSRNNFDKVVTEFEDVQAGHNAAFQEAQAAMNDAINQVIACACMYGIEFDALRKEKEVLEKAAKQTDVGVSRLAEKYNTLFHQLDTVQANIDQAVATMKHMRETNLSLDQEYELSCAERSRSEAAYAKALEEHTAAQTESAKQKKHLSTLLREYEDLDHLALDVKHKTETKVKELQARNAELEQMKIDCVEQTMALEKETEVTLRDTEEIIANTDAVKADNDRLTTELQTNKACILEIEQSVEQTESFTASLKAEIANQQNQLASLMSSIFSIQQANKKSFEATCMKMKELKGLHEVISRVQNECQKAELLKQERQSLLEATLRRGLSEEESEEEELKQLVNTVTYQRLAAQEAIERTEMSKQELYSACIENALKEAKKSQLEDLANEMERALYEVKQKQNECNELQSAIDSATRERELQAMVTDICGEDFDSEITKLNAQADHLHSAALTGSLLQPSFSEQELEDIDTEVQAEYGKFCNSLDMKQQREVDEIESYREQIRRSNSSSSKATRLKAEINELEALISEAKTKLERGESFSPNFLKGKENVTNLGHGRKLVDDANKSLSSLWDFKPAAALAEKAGSSGLSSFKRRKTTPSSRMSDMDASMEDLFADDI